MCIVVCDVFCGMRMLDVDGSCVCDGSIMNVRIKMNVNVNPYSYSYPYAKNLHMSMNMNMDSRSRIFFFRPIRMAYFSEKANLKK